jgi:hypothetical protein
MESGLIMAILLSSVVGTGAVAGVATMNGGMMQNDMNNGGMMSGGDWGTGGMHHMHGEMHCDQYGEHDEHEEECGEHELEECEEYQWRHQHCEEEMTEHEEDEHDDGCGMMG